MLGSLKPTIQKELFKKLIDNYKEEIFRQARESLEWLSLSPEVDKAIIHFSEPQGEEHPTVINLQSKVLESICLGYPTKKLLLEFKDGEKLINLIEEILRKVAGIEVKKILSSNIEPVQKKEEMLVLSPVLERGVFLSLQESKTLFEITEQYQKKWPLKIVGYLLKGIFIGDLTRGIRMAGINALGEAARIENRKLSEIIQDYLNIIQMMRREYLETSQFFDVVTGKRQDNSLDAAMKTVGYFWDEKLKKYFKCIH